MFNLATITNFDKKSASYIKFLQSRNKCRDLYEGEEKIKEQGETYLPKLQLQDAEMYKAYKMRARFYNVFKKTVQGFVGLMLRKNYILDFDKEINKEVLEDVTLSGVSFNQYLKDVLTEVLKVGFCGTLVDYPTIEETKSVLDAENDRPTMTFFKSENIIDYNFTKVNGVLQLSFLLLKYQNIRKIDLFKEETIETYIVLMLDTLPIDENINEIDGDSTNEMQAGEQDTTIYYRHVVIESNQGVYIIKSDVFPEMNGDYMQKIPFFFHCKDEYPPLNDLADANVKHYQLKADHNHALHYIGLPTPIFPGIDPNDPNKPSCLGPERIVYISDPQAKPFYLELEGKGLDKIESELGKIEEDMAFLGASMIASETNVDETATKAEIRYTQETSHLSSIADDVSESFTKTLSLFFEWKGENDLKVNFQMNKDYNPLRLTAQELTALIQGQISGQYSKRTLFDVLKRGEIMPEDRTFEEEQDLINNGE